MDFLYFSNDNVQMGFHEFILWIFYVVFSIVRYHRQHSWHAWGCTGVRSNDVERVSRWQSGWKRRPWREGETVFPKWVWRFRKKFLVFLCALFTSGLLSTDSLRFVVMDNYTFSLVLMVALSLPCVQVVQHSSIYVRWWEVFVCLFSKIVLPYFLLEFLICWLLINWSIFRFIIHWSFSWLIVRLIDWLIDRLTDCSIDWLTDWLIDWLIDSWIHSLPSWSNISGINPCVLFIHIFHASQVELRPRKRTRRRPPNSPPEWCRSWKSTQRKAVSQKKSPLLLSVWLGPFHRDSPTVITVSSLRPPASARRSRRRREVTLSRIAPV